MTTWTPDELARIGHANILEIAGRRSDGTLRRAVPIWAVRVSDRLFVRSVDGRGAAWFRGIQEMHEGHVTAGGVGQDVTFVESGPGVDAIVDAVYRTKYGSSIGVERITSQAAREATLELLPTAPS